MRVTNGTTDQVINFYAVDSTDFTTPEGGKVTGDWTVYWSKNGSAATLASHTITEIDGTNMLGLYKLNLDFGTTLTAGNDSEDLIILVTASGVAPIPLQVEIYRPKATEGATIGVTGSAVDDVTLVATTTTNTDMRGTDGAYTGTPPTAGAIADQVWDESISAHVTANSFGRQLWVAGAIIQDTTATGTPTTTTVQLSAGSTDDDYYNDMQVVPKDGDVNGQARIITDYDGATKTVTIDEAWTAAPTSGDAIAIRAIHAHPIGQIADSVWDEALSGHATAGSAGKALADIETDATAILLDTGTTLPAAIAVVDANVDSILALIDDPAGEPGQGAPPASADLVDKIAYLYKWARNKKDADGTTNQYYADDGTTVDQKQTTSEVAGTVTTDEMASGP